MTVLPVLMEIASDNSKQWNDHHRINKIPNLHLLKKNWGSIEECRARESFVEFVDI